MENCIREVNVHLWRKPNCRNYKFLKLQEREALKNFFLRGGVKTKKSKIGFYKYKDRRKAFLPDVGDGRQ